MTEIKDLNKVYNECESDGIIKFKEEVDIELIKSISDVAEKGLRFIKERSKGIVENSTDWTFVFRDYYEALRGLIEAFLLFDKVDAENHQCKNAYICFKHPELELDWNFLETVRLRRNAVNYKGQLLKHEDWKKFKLQFDLHINKLKREIEKKLEEN